MSFLVANETGAPPIWIKGMSLLDGFGHLVAAFILSCLWQF
jgi:hypothetical protein